MTTFDTLHASAFVLTIRQGYVEEYRRRHTEVWPELMEALLASGVLRYDIHLNARDRKVFGSILRCGPPDPAAPEHPAVLRWRAFMADVLEMDSDQPRRDPIEHVFVLAAPQPAG